MTKTNARRTTWHLYHDSEEEDVADLIARVDSGEILISNITFEGKALDNLSVVDLDEEGCECDASFDYESECECYDGEMATPESLKKFGFYDHPIAPLLDRVHCKQNHRHCR